MPFYYNIDGRKENQKRIAKGLLRLKESFTRNKQPKRTVTETLLLATWNIREFDSPKYGRRGKEPIFYIAEVISQFDLVAVQEVRDDLTALNKLMRYLGGWWKYLLTDVTQGSQGNRERMAFVYDSRKINFGGFASEIVIPPVEKKGKVLEPAKQLARTPFMVGFRVGWFKFTICTTHILYGQAIANNPDRIKEIEALAEFLADRTKEKYAWSKNMILLGDFNIFKPEDRTLQAITRQGFFVPKQIQKLPSNVAQNKHYDQMAFIAPDIQDQLELCNAGVINYYEQVYRPEDEEVYQEDMGQAYTHTKEGKKRDKAGRTRYYKDWRTYQMSDHLPLWIELQIDFGKQYLNKKIRMESAPLKTVEPMP
ncbi:MAG TPA: endonuclease/exonuclease/phosphatase family protein [Pyrinomonadaceae bacterium]|jgi:endonuclease/exonuclease/phosphatase family metal-dependent hydrolase|nr:endonuclease/exonuclease/phosphatase family protein [Pyrinomonadaceae bacterium]